MRRPLSRWSSRVLALSFCLGLGCLSVTKPVAPPETVRITLLQLNDVYQFAPLEGGRVGGLARVATLRKQILAENQQKNTLTLFAGDTLAPSVESISQIGGKPLQGQQMIDAWNALGVDYAVPGNHDFDFGDEVLRERIKASRFPWLAANIFDNHSGRPFEGLHPYMMVQLDGVKVGLFGLLLPETEVSSSVSQDTNIRDICSTAKPVISRLRAQGATVIIALTHLEVDDDQELARCAPVDVIIGGHDHIRIEDRSTGVPIFKVAADAVELGRVTLEVDGKSGKVKKVDWKVYPVTDAIPDDPTFVEALQKYAPLVAELSQRVGSTPVPLDARKTVVRTQETNLGSLIADALRQAAGTDVALVNGGAIRGDTIFPAGELTRREMLSIFPYRDQLVKLQVTGDILHAALENAVSKIEEVADPPGRFLQVSGLRFAFDPSRPKGQRVLCVTVGGKPLSPKASYTLATLSFLAGGKDGYEMFRTLSPTPALQEGRTPRDVLSDALRGGKPAPMPTGDGRIQRLQGGSLQGGECAPAAATR
ncbi:bifunctional metallophosphatase/5'-nucleotidase [Hyalangium versicolor]|uniref:bifunctional metallophosphatase/5'-nucleotidase n=1 Tax=Hyalangium versicolor TaxID=2861190 RepID=UPI001CCFA04D|nr:bifunctional UDP-sugar hydrolase/5'-nucleotidase [Hyalangium versicolor]